MKSLLKRTHNFYFLKIAQPLGRTWDLLFFIYILSSKPLDHSATTPPFTIHNFLVQLTVSNYA